jgi:hypothetical protein
VGPRIGAVILALAAAIVCAVGIAVMLDVSDTGICADAAPGADCYDFSSSAKPFVLIFGWAGSIVAGLTALAALGFTIRGRGGRAVLLGTGLAIVLLAISIIIARAG